ncbi:hypothetical protein [Sphingomonas sp.]|uniref:hypothetical protein n=1 Tax=Sphingomonas sp. TaxID=28214 RepID=UPI002FC7546C
MEEPPPSLPARPPGTPDALEGPIGEESSTEAGGDLDVNQDIVNVDALGGSALIEQGVTSGGDSSLWGDQDDDEDEEEESQSQEQGATASAGE